MKIMEENMFENESQKFLFRKQDLKPQEILFIAWPNLIESFRRTNETLGEAKVMNNDNSNILFPLQIKWAHYGSETTKELKQC